jgi:hypothetical protein
MAATAVAKPTPYFGPAQTKFVLFASAIADQTTGVPTRAEINAGSELSPALANFEGGVFSANSQDVQNWSSLNVDKVPNFNTLSDLTLTFNADVAGADPRTLFTQGSTYNLFRMDTGDTPTRKGDMFFVTVASKSKEITTSGNAKYVIGMTAQKVFTDITIPA